MAETDGARPRIVRELVVYSLTAEQLHESVIGELVALSSHTYESVAGGELVGFTRTGATFVLRVRSEADGRVSRYRLAPDDEVRVYGLMPEISDQA